MNLVVLPGEYSQIATGAPLRANKAIADLLATGFGLRDAWRACDLDDAPESGAHAVQRTRLRCLVAREPIEIAAAHQLVRRRYASRGYRVVEPAGLAFPDDARAAQYFTLVVQSPSATVGTVTLGMDSTHGLLVDEVNKKEADQLRARGRRLCELVRLAVENGVNSKAVLASLFRWVYATCRCKYDLTDVLIEVNPRHVLFYRRVFGFGCLSEEKFCERVGARSVLLALDIDALLIG